MPQQRDVGLSESSMSLIDLKQAERLAPAARPQLIKRIGMTEEAQGKAKPNVADTISIGIVEKAWEFKWGIQLVYLGLYADAVLACVLHRNLLSVTSSSSQIWESVGALLIGVAGFCLTVSLIIPTISGILKTTIIECAPNFLINTFGEHSARRDEISLHYLHTEALKTKDEFLMAIYREQQPSAIRKSAEHRQSGTLISGLVLLMIADIWAGYASGTDTLLLLLARGHELAFYLSLAPTMVVLLIWASLRPYPRDNIYHPTLRKQQDQERAAIYGRGDADL